MRRNVIFRVDANSEIGLGHFMRCFALALFLENHFHLRFCLKDPMEAVVEQIKTNDLSYWTIPSEEEFLRDCNAAAIVVLDGYTFDADFQRRIKETAAALVCIDDLHRGKFFGDVILNHAPGIHREMYEAEPGTTFLLGPEYALIRPAFLRRSLEPRVVSAYNHILINFGGSDGLNLTRRTIDVVTDGFDFERITVVTGPGYRYGDDLAKQVTGRKNVELLHNLDEGEMFAAMSACDLAIVPSSGVLFETIATRTPCVSGYYVDNQKGIYDGFKAMDVFYDATDFSADAIAGALREALASDPAHLIANQSRCIDGKSPERLLAAFQTLAHS